MINSILNEKEDKNKLNFLTNIHLNDKSIANIIKEHKLWNMPSFNYNHLVKLNARNTNESISATDLLTIYKHMYDVWYESLKRVDVTKLNSRYRSRLEGFLHNDKFKPQNMDPEKCHDFIHYDREEIFQDFAIFPAKSQDDNQSPLDAQDNVYSDFIHCIPIPNRTSKSECKLYLNMKQKNIKVLTEKLTQQCNKYNLRLYFKFWTGKIPRNDTFMIFCTYDNVQQMVNILRQIHKDNPNLFEGCEQINPLFSTIDDFIGFAENPTSSNSFNEERAYAIQEFLSDIVTDVIKRERKRIGTYEGTIQTSNGNKLSLQDYLSYLIENSCSDVIAQHQEDINAGYIPTKYKQRSVDSYIKMEKQIVEICKNELPSYVKQQIKQQAKEYLDGLKNGEDRDIQIYFPTNDINLFPKGQRNSLQQQLDNNQSLQYPFKFDYDLQYKLFSMFNSDAEIEKVITDKAIEPYLTNHNISAHHPSINASTEQFLANNLIEPPCLD